MSDATPITPVGVATWMMQKLTQDKNLYQSDAAEGILTYFGKAFVYENENGTLAIGKQVLSEFRKLTQNSAVWEPSGKYWRLREITDQAGQRRVS